MRNEIQDGMRWTANRGRSNYGICLPAGAKNARLTETKQIIPAGCPKEECGTQFDDATD
jgi:hypothetical protein